MKARADLYGRGSSRAASALLNPAVPFASFLCLAPVFPLFPGYFGISRPAYWVLSYLGICIASSSRDAGWKNFRLQFVDWLFITFVIVVLVSWAATERTGGGRIVSHVFAIMLVPWVAARFLTIARIGDVLRYTLFFGASMAATLFVVLRFMSGPDESYLTHEMEARVLLMDGTTIYAVFGPTIGLLAVISATWLLLPFRVRSNWWNCAMWILFPLSLFVTVQTGARAMLVAAVAAVLVLCVLRRKEKFSRRTGVIVVMTLTVVIGLWAQPPARQSHFGSLIAASTTLANAAASTTLANAYSESCKAGKGKDSIAVRAQLYGEAVNQFISQPLTGVGAGRFGMESCYYAGIPLAHPHSTILHVLSELGVMGMAPFALLNLTLIFFLWRLFLSRPTGDTEILMWLVGVAWVYEVVLDQFSGNYLTMLHYYMFSGLVASLWRLARKGDAVTAVAVPARAE